MNHNTTSKIITSILSFYILISSNYLGELYPCSLQKLLTTNMVAKHVLGLFTMLTIVMNDEKIDLISDLKSSLLIYSLYVGSTKCHKAFLHVSIFCAMVAFLMEKYKDDKYLRSRIKKETFDETSVNLFKLGTLSMGTGVLVKIGQLTGRKDFSIVKYILGETACVK